jgi:hypothetical protein
MSRSFADTVGAECGVISEPGKIVKTIYFKK